MRTVDQLVMQAPVERVFEAAANVERWPDLLPHYRWVTMRERNGDGGIVEMAAWRPFGNVRWWYWIGGMLSSAAANGDEAVAATSNPSEASKLAGRRRMLIRLVP